MDTSLQGMERLGKNERGANNSTPEQGAQIASCISNRMLDSMIPCYNKHIKSRATPLFNAVSTPDSYYTMQANAFLFQNLQRFPLIHLDLIVNPGKAMVAERKSRFLRKPVSFPEKTTKGEN